MAEKLLTARDAGVCFRVSAFHEKERMTITLTTTRTRRPQGNPCPGMRVRMCVNAHTTGVDERVGRR